MGRAFVGLFAEDLFRCGSGGGVLDDGIDFQLQNVCPFGGMLGESGWVTRFNKVPAEN
jgi:hypothetical protein